MSSNAQPPTGESFLSLQELTLREWLSYCRIKTSLLLLKYHLKSVKYVNTPVVKPALSGIRINRNQQPAGCRDSCQSCFVSPLLHLQIQISNLGMRISFCQAGLQIDPQ
jgi:hypothetical protein